MYRYIQAKGDRRASGREQTQGALHEQAAASRPLPGAPRGESPQETALMQMRQAFDESPQVKSQLALQRALNQRAEPATPPLAVMSGARTIQRMEQKKDPYDKSVHPLDRSEEHTS